MLKSSQSANSLPNSLRNYLDIFSAANTKKLAPYHDINIAIKLLLGKEPLYRLIYPLLQTKLAALRDFLEENLAKGFIRESKSPIGTPILFIPKKDRSLRLYIDYRGLNTIIVKNYYLLPLVTEIIDRVTRAQYFSKINLKDIYYRLQIKEGDEQKIAFCTYYRHYKFLVIPIGITNTPITFQVYINKAL